MGFRMTDQAGKPGHGDGAAHRRRKALRESLAAAEMTPTDAARAAGMKSANAIFNFLNNRTKSLSQTTIEALVKVIPGATMAALTGMESSDTIGPIARPIQVRAVATAGLMQASFDLPASQQSQIVATVSDDMFAQGIFGVEVRPPGAELLFPPSTVLLCLPINSFEGVIGTGKRLILQRIHGSRVEVTVREIVIEADEAWLWLRSSHPEHQSPIQIPWVPGQPPKAWRVDEDRYSVAAVVVLAIVPQP